MARSGRIVGFGICHGTTAPCGSATPKHFLGVKTSDSWTRDGHWWESGFEAIRSVNGTDTVLESGDARFRISEDDTFASAWYLRFTKLNAGSMRVELFLPNGSESPNSSDFDFQLQRETFNECVNNHRSYRLFSIDAAISETNNGTLNAVNIFSNVETFDTETLRPIEWLEVKAVRIE